MRYPDRQNQHDCDDEKRHGSQARIRPDTRVRVRGFIDGKPGPTVLGVVLLSRKCEHGEQVMVSTREYGRAWFNDYGHPFQVIEELG